jgi:hypothetical protein
MDLWYCLRLMRLPRFCLLCSQDLWGEAASEMLTVQYRMNAAIMDWSSQVPHTCGPLYRGMFIPMLDLLPLHCQHVTQRPAGGDNLHCTVYKQELYGGRLTAHESVAMHTLADLAGTDGNAAELPVLLLIDTAGCDMEEQAEEEGDSKVRGRLLWPTTATMKQQSHVSLPWTRAEIHMLQKLQRLVHVSQLPSLASAVE